MASDPDIDRAKHDVDVLEHVLRGIRAEVRGCERGDNLPHGRSRPHRGPISAAEVRAIEQDEDSNGPAEG